MSSEKKPLLEHFMELRRRLMTAYLLSTVSAVIITTLFYKVILKGLSFVYNPEGMCVSLPLGGSLIRWITLMLDIQLVLIFLVLGCIMWGFVRPALYLREVSYFRIIFLFWMALPFIAIALAAVYSRLLGIYFDDITVLVDAANKFGLFTLLTIMAIVGIVIAKFRNFSGFSVKLIAALTVLVALMIILWPIWVFAVSVNLLFFLTSKFINFLKKFAGGNYGETIIDIY